MKTSELGKQFIKSFEKCRLVAYDDGVGVWTIGWGHTKGVKKGMACTQENADAWFAEELDVFERSVTNSVKVPVTTRQNDALVSFAYNVGAAALRSSTLMRLINEGNYVAASNRFEDWNKGNVNGQLIVLDGLTKRRRAEAKIFRVGIYDMHDGPSIDGNQIPDFGDVQSGSSTTA